jgi:hypothetical protein
MSGELGSEEDSGLSLSVPADENDQGGDISNVENNKTFEMSILEISTWHLSSPRCSRVAGQVVGSSVLIREPEGPLLAGFSLKRWAGGATPVPWAVTSWFIHDRSESTGCNDSFQR